MPAARAVPNAGRPPLAMYLGIGLCSVAVLMQEILLTRIFSLTIWYHLAYLTLSTALLGFAAAGSLLARRPGWLAQGGAPLAAFSAAGAGLALIAALYVLAPRPIEPLHLLESPVRLFGGLLAYYLVVAVPFLLAGLAVAAPLSAFPARADRLYAADLLGAGLGCLAAVAALTWADGGTAVVLCAAVFVSAAACYSNRRSGRIGFAVLSAGLALAAPRLGDEFRFVPAGTKALGMAMADPRMETLLTRWSPVNRVDLFRVGDQRGGWWGANGLSKKFVGKLPRTIAIQYDGHNGSDVQDTREPDALRMLDQHLLRTPYALRPQERVLVIGVGGGIDVQNALRRGAAHVTGVDLQPITIELHRGPLAELTGNLASRPEVELVAGEGRHFARASDAHFDLIQITAVDTFSAQTTGAYVLAESYLYTLEAFEDYFRRLDDDGMVSIVIGDVIQPLGPPPLLARLALTGREALARAGVAKPEEQVLVVTYNLGITASMHSIVVKKTPFTEAELAAVAAFTEENGFRVDAAPGLARSPVARLLGTPAAELPQRLASEAFALAPATDDRPFFFNVVRWDALFSDQTIFWMFPGSSVGLLVLAMMLGQAILLGGVLILLPLARTRTGALPRGATVRFLLYFLGLGLGFMLIEISFVQKYVLLLGYPTYSLSVTIFSLIVAAACGAAVCRRGWGRPRALLLGLAGATAGLVALEVLVLPALRDALLGASLATRIATTVLLQFPLGFVLGMYFPTGLELLRRREPGLVPWAWAVNGVASVAATVLAVILGIELGFTLVALLAVAIYAVGALSLRSLLPADAP